MSLLVQEFDIQVLEFTLVAEEVYFRAQLEESLIWNVLGFVNQVSFFQIVEKPISCLGKRECLFILARHAFALSDESLSQLFQIPSVKYSKLFFQLLQLQPLAVNLSFEVFSAFISHYFSD